MARKGAGGMIDEQLIGRLIEAVDNLKEDGRTRGDALGRLSDRVEDLRLSINGLTQTTQSLSNQIVRLDAEKCDERLTKLEEKAKRYDRLLGNASTFIWKVIGGIVISGLSGGGIALLVLRG